MPAPRKRYDDLEVKVDVRKNTYLGYSNHSKVGGGWYCAGDDSTRPIDPVDLTVGPCRTGDTTRFVKLFAEHTGIPRSPGTGTPWVFNKCGFSIHFCYPNIDYQLFRIRYP